MHDRIGLSTPWAALPMACQTKVQQFRTLARAFISKQTKTLYMRGCAYARSNKKRTPCSDGRAKPRPQPSI